MKMPSGVAIVLIIASVNVANAQMLKYESDGGSSRTSTREDREYERTLYLDGDRAHLPSDISHAKWARQLLPFFKSLDVDGDTVLSEYDLRDVPADAASQWSRDTVETVLTFWHPDIEEHLTGLRREMMMRAGDHRYLEAAAEDALDDIEDVYDMLGLDSGDLGSVYVSAIADEDAVKVREGLVNSDARKWVEMKVPFTLEVSRGEERSEFPMIAHVMSMMSFPRFEGDSRLVLWRLSVSSRDDK